MTVHYKVLTGGRRSEAGATPALRGRSVVGAMDDLDPVARATNGIGPEIAVRTAR